MFDYLEKQTRLTGNQRRIIGVAILANMLEFYDLYVVGFVLAFIVGPWKITYGESAIILLSSGVGAVIGGAWWGWLADRIGRQKVLIGTILTFSVATGILALTPERNWIFFTFFRFFVGFGVSGLYCVILPLVQEFIPASRRGFLSGIVTAFVPLGLGLGAVVGAFLAPVVGWRGPLAVGLLPALLVILIRAWVPESPQWLLRAGRLDEARRSLAWALEIEPKNIQLPKTAVAIRAVPWRELFRYPRSLAVSWIANLGAQTGIYGLALWVPTLLAQVLHIPPARAAYLMIYCSFAGFLGRITFSWLSDAIGRRPSGGLMGFGAAIMLTTAGVFHDQFVGTISVFWLLLMVAYFLADGGFSIVGPYSAEVWPASLRTTGMGAAYGFGGLGKIIGPLGLALIVGSSDVVKPEASVARIIPAFVYLGAWFALAGAVYSLFAIETRGRSIDEIGSEVTNPPVSQSRTM